MITVKHDVDELLLETTHLPIVIFSLWHLLFPNKTVGLKF